jgi:hypothetical protein
MLRALFALQLVVVLLVSGCAQAAQTVVEKTTGVQVNQKGDTVTVKGKDGEQVTISSKLPDELKTFPVPQGFSLETSGSMSSGDGNLATGSWKGKASVQDVAAFYKKTMTDQGWKEEYTFSADDASQASYSKDGQLANVTMSKEDSGSTVTVLLTKKK